MRALIFISVLFISYSNCRTIQFYIEPAQKLNPTYVQQLVEGSLKRVEHGMNLTSSVSMVYDGGHYIIVDSPSATDVHSKEQMLKGIGSRNIAPGEIQYAVTTHGHPDHFGQGNFFPNARHFFGSYEYSDTNYISTELHTNDTMQLTKNVQLWNTPGHTAQDVTVMVHNVPCCGIIAVAGTYYNFICKTKPHFLCDLFYHEEDANEAAGIWFQEAWNPIIGKLSRNKVLCYADYIIPGHGKLFRDDHTGNEAKRGLFRKIRWGYRRMIRKPSETLFSSAHSINSPYLQDVKVTTTKQPESTTLSATPQSTTNFFTVDLAAETPSSRDEGVLLNLQENLPPIGISFNKNVIEVPHNLEPIVENLAKKVSEVLKPQNDTQILQIVPHIRKWRETVTNLLKQYTNYN